MSQYIKLIMMILIVSSVAFAQEIPAKDIIVDKETIIDKEVIVDKEAITNEAKADLQKEFQKDVKKEARQSKESIADLLNLSRDQISELRDHRKTFKSEKVKLNKEMAEIKKELNSELLKPEPNEEKVKELTSDISKINEIKQDINNKSTRELTKILDEDQLEKLKYVDRSQFSREGKKISKRRGKDDIKMDAKSYYKKGVKEEYKKDIKEDYKKDVKEEYKKDIEDDYKEKYKKEKSNDTKFKKVKR